MTRDDPPRGTVEPRSAAIGSCPACGGPLFGWVRAFAADARSSDTYVVDRCEDCGLGLVREAAVDVDALLAAAPVDADGVLRLRAPNRRSLQAALGEGRWAALDLPRAQLIPTAEALARAMERHGRRLRRVRFPVLAANQLWMWQTLMNALTLQPNFAREALARRLTPSSARSRFAFALDAVVSVVAAPLVALVSFPLETLAGLIRRGGLLAAEIETQPSSTTSSASSAAASS